MLQKVKKISLTSLALGATLGFASFASAAQPTLPPQPAVLNLDLSALGGPWFEVARIGGTSSVGCYDSALDLAPIATAQEPALAATFRCWRLGVESIFNGQFKVADPTGNGRLVLSNDLPLVSDQAYNVVAAAADYSWFVLGEDTRSELYIYARSPELDAGTLVGLINHANADWGYDNAHKSLQCTVQKQATTNTCAEVLAAHYNE